MFTYRQLILAVIILSAKIIFADILVPSYKLQYGDNPSYQRSQSTITIPNYKVPSAVVQYAKQIAVQPSNQNPSKVQTVLPNYGVYQDKVRSNLVGYPHHSKYHYPYHHHQFTKPTDHSRYMKLGISYGHVRPSIFVGYSNPLAVHYRRKRSTSISDKPAVADVATKSTLIDTKHPRAIDSLLPENESTNTNDKHVKNRRRDVDFATKPSLFGLDPNKMYSELKAKNLDKTEDETQHSLSKRHPATLITPVILSQFTPDSTKTTATEPAKQMLTYQDKGQNQEASNTNHENLRPTPSVPSTPKNLEQPSSPITIYQMQSSEEESQEDSKYYNFGMTHTNMYALPMSTKYPYWFPHYMYNAQKHPSNSKKYPHQQNASNHPIMQQTSDQASSQETTNVATNTAHPRQDKTRTNLCPEGVQCPTSNQMSSKSEIISAPNPNTHQVFYINPYSTNYYSGEYITDYQDNEIKTDYDDDYGYDEDDYDENDDGSTYLTDGFYLYNLHTNTNSAYSRNVPSNKFYDNYANAPSNAPVTYVVSTSPNVQPRLNTHAYYYPTTKTYMTYKPNDYNYYKYYYNSIYPNHQNVPNIFYRANSSPVSSSSSYYYY